MNWVHNRGRLLTLVSLASTKVEYCYLAWISGIVPPLIILIAGRQKPGPHSMTITSHSEQHLQMVQSSPLVLACMIQATHFDQRVLLVVELAECQRRICH
jgi:hypothetical protein